MIGAVVIAAGASYRMRSPKALLRIEDKTFLQHIIDVLRSAGIDETVVVLGAEAENIQHTLSWFDGRVVVNGEWEQGQLTSINAGLGALLKDGLEAAIVCPVDHPLISNRLIVGLLAAFRESKRRIVLPVFQGHRGHPVLFSSDVFEELRNADVSVGAREVVRNHPKDVYEMVTDEEGVAINIDTPEDYEAKIANRLVK